MNRLKERWDNEFPQEKHTTKNHVANARRFKREVCSNKSGNTGSLQEGNASMADTPMSSKDKLDN